MAKINTGLGRGLSALISGAEDIHNSKQNTPNHADSKGDNHKSEENRLLSSLEIPIEKIEPNPYQPRTEFNEEAIEELASSIKLLGLIQPITVRYLDSGNYQIISGERRYRASKLAGLKTIPAYIKSANDHGMLEMAIVENIQREDLDSIEVALSFQRLIDECELTQEEMANRVGKKRTSVTNYLRLLKLPAEIQFAIRAKKISMGHAKVLLSLDNPRKQMKLANQIIDMDLSVRQTEQKVKSQNEKKSKVSPNDDLPDKFFRTVELVGRYFNNNVSIKRTPKGNGSMTIRFKNDAEIDSFLSALESIKE